MSVLNITAATKCCGGEPYETVLFCMLRLVKIDKFLLFNLVFPIWLLYVTCCFSLTPVWWFWGLIFIYLTCLGPYWQHTRSFASTVAWGTFSCGAWHLGPCRDRNPALELGAWIGLASGLPGKPFLFVSRVLKFYLAVRLLCIYFHTVRIWAFSSSFQSGDSGLISVKTPFFFFFSFDLTTCGILVSQPAIESRPSAMKIWNLKHWLAVNSQISVISVPLFLRWFFLSFQFSF